MSEIAIELEALTSFRTPNLTIEAELAGASHTFDLEGVTVGIKLPAAPEGDGGRSDNADRPIWCRHWQRVGDQKMPVNYVIGEIQVVVSKIGSHRLPAAMLERHPNADDLLSDDRQRDLDKLSAKSFSISERAFDRWTRTLRWKTGNWKIGRSDTNFIETGKGTVLRQTVSSKRLWVYHPGMVVHAEIPVTTRQWDLASQALVAGIEPPIFVDLLLDAEMHFSVGDYRRSAIDAAVAAETYMRTTVDRSMPNTIGSRIRTLVNKSNVRPVMESLFPEALTTLGLPQLEKATASTIHKLLDVRNVTLHDGIDATLDSAKCAKYLEAVHELLARHIGSQDEN